MPGNLLDDLEKKYEALTEGKTKLGAYHDFILKSVKNCSNLDEVDNLFFYALRDDWEEGIAVCEEIAGEALKLRNAGKIGGLERGDKEASKSFEYVTIARAFAAYGKPNSKEFFRKYFDKAISEANSYLDYEILAGTLATARRDMDDTELDPEFTRTRELLNKALELAIKEKAKISLESLASIAEYDLSDKKLAKSIKDSMKKIK